MNEKLADRFSPIFPFGKIEGGSDGKRMRCHRSKSFYLHKWLVGSRARSRGKYLRSRLKNAPLLSSGFMLWKPRAFLSSKLSLNGSGSRKRGRRGNRHRIKSTWGGGKFAYLASLTFFCFLAPTTSQLFLRYFRLIVK